MAADGDGDDGLRAIAAAAKVAPLDAANRTLINNVHPPSWPLPETIPPVYDLVVIGSGAAGLVSAIGSAGLGAKVALIEKHLLGGDCLTTGCVPSKAILRCARAVRDAKNAEAFGLAAQQVTVDFGRVMQRLRNLRADISEHDSAQRVRSLGVDVYLGEAAFNDASSIGVNGHTLRFHAACIATGARPSLPDIPGLRDVEFHTSETIFNLTELPKRLIVVGDGPIGCELAQAFALLGSEVHLFGRGSRVLPREDDEARRIVQESLVHDGVRLHPNTRYKAFSAREGGLKVLQYCEGDSDESREVVGDVVLVAVGRSPNVQGLQLEKAGIKYDEVKGVLVNDHMRTSNRRVYAAGDVCSAQKFTHAADAMARLVIRNALFFGSAKASALVIPRCTYTFPEVASVGLSEAEIKASGKCPTVYVEHFNHNDRGIVDSETEGFVKVVCEGTSDRILGATVVGPNAGDLISEIVMAMYGNIGLSQLPRVIHPYPTMAENIRKLGDQYNRTRVTPSTRRLLGWVIQLRRWGF